MILCFVLFYRSFSTGTAARPHSKNDQKHVEKEAFTAHREKTDGQGEREREIKERRKEIVD